MKRHKRIIILLIFIILIVFSILIYAKYFDEKIVFTLFGDDEITLYQGSNYIEYGFIAFNDDGNNVKDRVKIETNLDTSKVGEYEIEYSIKTALKKYRSKRIVNIIEDTLSEIDFSLKGFSIVNLNVGEKYNDPKFNCIHKTTKEDLSRYVITENSINNLKEGEYEIIYRLRYNGKEKRLIRKVYVFSQKNSYSISTLSMTNKPVSINFKSNIHNFSHVVCPNETIKKTNNFTYNFYENGKYAFYVYDTLNNYEEYVIIINNIDKIAPKGTCIAELSNGKTKYSVKSDDNDIANYLYNNEKRFVSKNSDYIAPIYHRNASVMLVDLAGNKSLINCEISRTYMKPLEYLDDSQIKYSSKSDTLQINIMEKDGYFLTHIWSKDPYLQAKKQMISFDSKKLVLPKKIVEQAIEKNKLYDKIVWSSNASGIVLKNVYYSGVVNTNSFYNLKEPSSLLVYNGDIIINDYEEYAAHTFIYYINASNELSYIPVANKKTPAERKILFDEALGKGIYNTFAFNAILVKDGIAQKVNNDYYALRNGFCQLDENNFLSVVSDTRRWNKPDFAKFMADLGCVTAVNFDGGGSCSLFYKDHNESSIRTLTGNVRANSSVIYFTEL